MKADRHKQSEREAWGLCFYKTGNEFIPSASNCQEMALEKALILQSRAETFPSGGFYSPSISVGMGCDSFTCPIQVKMTLVKMTTSRFFLSSYSSQEHSNCVVNYCGLPWGRKIKKDHFDILGTKVQDSASPGKSCSHLQIFTSHYASQTTAKIYSNEGGGVFMVNTWE